MWKLAQHQQLKKQKKQKTLGLYFLIFFYEAGFCKSCDVTILKFSEAFLTRKAPLPQVSYCVLKFDECVTVISLRPGLPPRCWCVYLCAAGVLWFHCAGATYILELPVLSPCQGDTYSYLQQNTWSPLAGSTGHPHDLSHLSLTYPLWSGELTWQLEILMWGGGTRMSNDLLAFQIK